jgi:hypothetical protein
MAKHRQTQRQRVEERLRQIGYIFNSEAIRSSRPILRLGAIIHELRKDGWEIKTDYKNQYGHRNCKYTLVAAPNQN